MPHKHTRRVNDDKSTHDLPPSSIARPLPVGKAAADNGTKTSKSKQKQSKRNDDTPRAFARVMQMQQGVKRSRDLDDGQSVAARKKQKRIDNNTAATAAEKKELALAKSKTVPKILPGERMSDFSARVDQALPIIGLNRKVKHIAGMPKERQTRLEKKIQGKISRWRTEEARRKELEQEKEDLAEQDDAEEDTKESEGALGGVQGKRKKLAKVKSGAGDDDDDPWAALKNVRDKPKGVFDVAQAPPNFTRIPKEIFKVKNGARVDVGEIPRVAGSLRQREELGVTRKSIIESYRKLVNAKREAS